MARTRKSKTKLYFEFIPFICLYKLLRLMPLKTAYWLSRSLFILIYHIDRKSRTRSIQHLLHSGIAKDTKDAKKISYSMFKHGGKLMTEFVKVDQNISKIDISFAGDLKVVDRLLMSGKDNTPAILVTAHYGNWEVSGRFWTEYSGIDLLTVVRPINNPLINKHIVKMRSNKKHKIISKQNSMKHMLKALHSNHSIAILSDQHASSTEGVETVFFDQPARTHATAALLHLRTGVPIAPMVLRCKNQLFHYEGDFSEIIQYEPTDDKEKDIAAVTQMYTSALEKLIRKDPSQWLWTHRRWLNKNREQADYISDVRVYIDVDI